MSLGITDLGSVSGAVALPLTTATIIHMTLNGNVTLSTGTFPAGSQWTLWITQNATTAYTVTWPSNVHGGGAVSATLGTDNVQDFFSDASSAALRSVRPMTVQ